jgi:hypothetical protein
MVLDENGGLSEESKKKLEEVSPFKVFAVVCAIFVIANVKFPNMFIDYFAEHTLEKFNLTVSGSLEAGRCIRQIYS